jgi:hypothetical protein
MFFSVLFCSVPFCSILFYSILFCSIPLYSVIFRYILFYSILFYSIPFYSVILYSVLFCSVLIRSALFCISSTKTFFVFRYIWRLVAPYWLTFCIRCGVKVALWFLPFVRFRFLTFFTRGVGCCGRLVVYFTTLFQ